MPEEIAHALGKSVPWAAQTVFFQAVTIAAVEAACAAHGHVHDAAAGPYIVGDGAEAVEHVSCILAVTWPLSRELLKPVRHTQAARGEAMCKAAERATRAHSAAGKQRK